MVAEAETTISETAELYGVTLRTLRFYEQRGLIAPLRAGTVRIYTTQDHIRLKLIQTGKRLRLSLTHIEALICDATRNNQESHAMEVEPHHSIVELLTRDEIEQQLQILERQRNDLKEAIEDLKAIEQSRP